MLVGRSRSFKWGWVWLRERCKEGDGKPGSTIVVGVEGASLSSYAASISVGWRAYGSSGRGCWASEDRDSDDRKTGEGCWAGDLGFLLNKGITVAGGARGKEQRQKKKRVFKGERVSQMAGQWLDLYIENFYPMSTKESLLSFLFFFFLFSHPKPILIPTI